MEDSKQAAALVNERAYAEVKRLVEEARAARERWYARRGRKTP
jgi:acyl-CoA reductase-like NAD-dependent aldehyde dehydrogenase